MEVPVVEAGAGLAGNGEGVFKARGGDEGDACAFAFEQGVGGDGGAVADFDGRPVADAMRSTASRMARPGSSGVDGSLRTSSLPAVAVDAVGEGAAGIDGDGEVGGFH